MLLTFRLTMHVLCSIEWNVHICKSKGGWGEGLRYKLNNEYVDSVQV